MTNQKSQPLGLGHGFRVSVLGALIVTLILSIAFVFAHAQIADAATVKFSDVNSKTPNSADIKWMAKKGLFKGDKIGGKYRFNGTKEMTRKDLAVIMHNLGKLYGVTDAACKKNIKPADVNSKTAGYKDIMWLVKTGVFTGDKVKKTYYFRPNQPVKRSEVSAAFYNLNDLINDGSLNKRLKSITDDTFQLADVYTNSPYATEIVWVHRNKVSQGPKTGTTTDAKTKKKRTLYKFNPEGIVKRQEFAGMLHRYDNLITQWFTFATMKVKNYGTVTLSLDKENAPNTVDHFSKLIKKGFFNGTTYHRIIKGFMAQGGKAKKGAKEAGTIKGEFQANQPEDGPRNFLPINRGTIAMARGNGGIINEGGSLIWDNGYNSASSEFFIMHKTPNKDSKGKKSTTEETKQGYDNAYFGYYAGFGHVITGIEVIDKICEKAKPTDDNGSIAAKAQPKITSFKVTH